MNNFKNKMTEAAMFKTEAEKELRTDSVYAIEKIEKLGLILKNLDYYKLYIQYGKARKEDSLLLDILEEALSQFPFNLDLNFEYCNLLESLGDYEACLERYYKASLMWPVSTDNRGIILKKACSLLKRIPDTILNDNQQIYLSLLTKLQDSCKEFDYHMWYPLLNDNTLAVGKVFLEGTEDEYFVSLYGCMIEKNEARYLINRHNKIEIIKGKKYTDIFEYYTKEQCVLPFAFIGHNHDFRLNCEINGKDYPFFSASLNTDRFYHFKLSANDTIQLKTHCKYFVGNPISLQHKPGLKKLVLYIFVDALSYKFLEDIGFEKSMPNTYQYFKEGFISNNCFATGEWTLTSAQSMLTGKYTTNHKKFHPDRLFDYSVFSKCMPEYFSQKGYFTSFITPDYTMTPNNGSYKGFDRIIYKTYGEYSNFDIIRDAIESIDSFGESNQFTLLALPDLHDANDMGFRELYASTNIDLKTRLSVALDGNPSVFQNYDECRIQIYEMYIKKLDVTLGILFDYLNKKYRNEDITVVMTSDHGQKFISKEKVISPNARGRVPLFIKDSMLKNIVSNEIINLTDILHILGKLCDFPVEKNTDGQLPKILGGDKERECSYTECIYPGQPYQACLASATHYLYFTSEGNANEDGMFHPGKFDFVYKNRRTENDEAQLYSEDAALLLDAVFEHIKNYILI